MARNTTGLLRTAGPGRPKGLPNKATREFKSWAEQFFQSPAYRQSAERRILSGKAPQLETYLAQLLHGKPKDQLEVTVPEPVQVINQFHGVTPAGDLMTGAVVATRTNPSTDGDC